jgi:hypothetical protein
MHKGSETHADAIERLNGARDEQRRCAEEHDAARGSEGELFAQAKLQAAEDQFAAREAWVEWTERDY